jgi:hypothetical protein
MIESEGFSHFWTFGESLAIPRGVRNIDPEYGQGSKRLHLVSSGKLRT